MLLKGKKHSGLILMKKYNKLMNQSLGLFFISIVSYGQEIKLSQETLVLKTVMVSCSRSFWNVIPTLAWSTLSLSARD